MIRCRLDAAASFARELLGAICLLRRYARMGTEDNLSHDDCRRVAQLVQGNPLSARPRTSAVAVFVGRLRVITDAKPVAIRPVRGAVWRRVHSCERASAPRATRPG